MREGMEDKSLFLYTPTIHSVGQLSTLLVFVTGSNMHLSTRNNVSCDILEEHGMLYCLKNHRRQLKCNVCIVLAKRHIPMSKISCHKIY